MGMRTLLFIVPWNPIVRSNDRVYGGKKCVLNGPPVMQPLGDHAVINTDTFTHFDQGARGPIYGYDPIAPSVPALLLPGSPPAISFAVGSVVINSVNTHTRWCLAHIHKKTLKGRCPFIAHRNAPTSVFRKRLTAWLRASPHHASPRFICSRRVVSAFMSMRNRVVIESQTAAGATYSRYQIPPPYPPFGSAGADAPITRKIANTASYGF